MNQRAASASSQSTSLDRLENNKKTTPIIEVHNLHRTFIQGDATYHVLKGVSLTIARGEYVAIQGTSGSGKSTLLHILGLLDKPTSGHYILDGLEVATLEDDAASAIRNRMTGFVFQNFYLIPYASALDNVLLPGIYSEVALKELRPRAIELLHKVGLGDRLDFTPSRLSGGQQQRVALARALLNQPQVILADEPTGQLDSNTSTEILELLADINASGTTVIVVTHDAETAASAKRLIQIHDGLIAYDGPSARIHPFNNGSPA